MRPISVGIDGYNLAIPHGTGVATYAFVLSETLRSMGHSITGVFGLDVGSRLELREILFFDRFQRLVKQPPRRHALRRGVDLIRSAAGLRTRDVPLTRAVEKGSFDSRMPFFDRLVSSTQLFEKAHSYFNVTGRFTTLRIENPPDIMHWTYPLPIRVAGARNIYTLHDLVPLRLPYATLDIKRNYHRLIRRCVEDADHICTVSEASKADILAMFPMDERRLSVTYQASPVPPDWVDNDPTIDAEMIHGIFGLPHQGYFLYFGAIEPKKNIGRLIEAYLTTQMTTPLVIVGARAWESEQELKLLGDRGVFGMGVGQRLNDRIIRLDYLPRHLLLRLIRGARAVAFPSLYEGFGLPVHEAMLLGTPVLTGATSSLPEIAGDAAVLVNPYDVDAIADGLRKLDSDAPFRRDLSERGQAHAKSFSVDRYRGRLNDLYEQVLTSALSG